METVNHKQLEYLIKKSYQTKKPLFIWGGTGIGKSQSARETAEKIAEQMNREFAQWNRLSKEQKHEFTESPKKYFFFLDLRASQFDPSDLRGLPNLNSKDSVEWKPPYWLKAMTFENAAGIIFCDEINLAPPSVFSAFYQLIHDRALGEDTLAKDVYVLSAGNRLKDEANIHPLPAPLRNRYIHCELNVPSKGDWIEWALDNEIDSRVITYIRANPSKLYGFRAKSGLKAFPTPRMWETVSDLIRNEKDLEKNRLLIGSAVGEGAAREFVAFLQLEKKLNLAKYLNEPQQVENINQTDLKHILIMLTVERWKDKPSQKLLEKIVELCFHLEKEFGMLLVRMLKRNHESKFSRWVKDTKGWKKLSREYHKFII